MNVFVLDRNPHLIARHYCNIHLVKMILEHVQLLCNVLPVGLAPYKRTHYNHPCSKWVRESSSNWEWLRDLTLSMGQEYTRRFNKVHKSCTVLEAISVHNPAATLPDAGLTAWPQVMPDEYKAEDSIDAYRKYYTSKLRDFRTRGICRFSKQ